MKKLIISIIMILSAHFSYAQTVSAISGVDEDWCTYYYCSFGLEMPSDIVTYDRDGHTLHFSMIQSGFSQGDSWIAKKEARSVPENYYAASPSKHKYATDEAPVAADDWMITPQIWIRGAGSVLTWRSKSICEFQKNVSSYKVLVSTSGNTPEDFTEEPVFTVADESATTWVSHEVSLAKYEGKRIYIAFVNTSLDREILAVDDIKVEGKKGLCELLVTTGEYVITKDIIVSCDMTAYTDEVINSFKAYYEYDGKRFKKEVSGIALSKNQTYSFSFDEKIPAEIGDTVNYSVWAEVNGVVTDKIDCASISYLFIPKRSVVVEEGTGMWCTSCPKGIVAMETLAEKYPDTFIGLALHYDDPLEVFEYRSAMEFPGGVPTAYVNRKYYVTNIMPQVFGSDGKMAYTTMAGGLETYYLSALSDMTIADISLKAEQGSDSKVRTTVTTRFAVGVNEADYQIAIVVVENDVTDPEYFQINGLSGSDIPMGGYESLPDRIQPFTFHEVVRGIYDTYQGVPGSVPATINAGEENVFVYDVVIPETVVSIQNAELVAMLVDLKTGEIMNAASVDANVAGLEDVLAARSGLNYSIDGDRCIVDFASESSSPAMVSLYSAGGVLLSTEVLNADGSCTFNVNGLSGLCFITVTQDNNTVAAKVLL